MQRLHTPETKPAEARREAGVQLLGWVFSDSTIRLVATSSVPQSGTRRAVEEPVGTVYTDFMKNAEVEGSLFLER